MGERPGGRQRTQIESTAKHLNVPAYETIHGRLNTSSELPELQKELEHLQTKLPRGASE